MRRSLALLLIVCAVYGIGIYNLKYRVAHLESRLTAAQRQVIAEKESIHILNAELSYITRPDQIGKMASKYLQLSPIPVKQIYDVASVMPNMPYTVASNTNNRGLANGTVAEAASMNMASAQQDDVTQSPVAYDVQ